jgi:hypothetical protein
MEIAEVSDLGYSTKFKGNAFVAVTDRHGLKEKSIRP